MLNRSDLRVDPTDNSVRDGQPLGLSINMHQISDTGCGPLANAQVDLWHCDAAGTYSDIAAQNTQGKKFLRGYQVTDANGAVQFTTVYPGWYNGRTVHIHVKIRVFSGSQAVYEYVAQFFFDDSMTDQVYTLSPYSLRGTRDTRNATDSIYSGASTDGSVATNNGALLMLNLTQTSTGYAATIDLGLKINRAQPAVTGVVNAASLQAGAVAGSRVIIKGTDIASFAYTLNPQADLVNGVLPNTLSGVSVTVDGKPAFVYDVSPTAISIQAPDDTATRPAAVTLTNFGGTSNPLMVETQSTQPALFTAQGYAVTTDASLLISSSAQGGGPGSGPGGAPGGGFPGGGTPPTGTPPGGMGPGGAPPGGGGTPPSGAPPGGAGSTVATSTSVSVGATTNLYGTGFGPAAPAVPAGALPPSGVALANTVTVTIGGVPATVTAAALLSTRDCTRSP